MAAEGSAEASRKTTKDTGYRGTIRSPKTQPATRQPDEYEDNFIVNDEEDMEKDYDNGATLDD